MAEWNLLPHEEAKLLNVARDEALIAHADHAYLPNTPALAALFEPHAQDAQPAPSVPEGWKLVPIEVVDLYSFMCSAFTPMTPQQDQIAIQLDLAKRAMLTSSLGLVDQAMTRSAAIRARGEPDAP